MHDDQPPLINAMIEDVLAHAVDETARADILRALLLIGAEYLARQLGRAETREYLRWLDAFIREAQPVRPWRP